MVLLGRDAWVAWFLLALKVWWQKFGVVQYSGVHYNYLKYRKIHPPLEQMKVYGIVLMTVEGILCFDVLLLSYFWFKNIQTITTA